MPAAAGAIRSTSIAPSRWPKPRASQAIEIEDQLLPRRVEHHVGIDNLVPTEFFVKKLKEALAARTDPDLVIVARTNARRTPGGMDEVVRRGAAFAEAGADMVFCFTRNPEEMRIVSERVPHPLMTFAPVDGFATSALSRARFRQARVPAGGVLRHGLCRHVQGGAAVLSVPGAGQAGPVPRPGRRRQP